MSVAVARVKVDDNLAKGNGLNEADGQVNYDKEHQQAGEHKQQP